jgi:hypothetical protein
VGAGLLASGEPSLSPKRLLQEDPIFALIANREVVASAGLTGCGGGISEFGGHTSKKNVPNK